MQAIKEYKKTKSTRKFKVIVCSVKSDCILRAFKPVFLCSREGDDFSSKFTLWKIK